MSSAAGSAGDEKSNLWSILPSFDPEKDDPRELQDKVKFLHGICHVSEKGRTHASPEASDANEGNSLGSDKAHGDQETDRCRAGNQDPAGAKNTWEEAAEMQVHDRFEKVLYRTTQRSDELTQSYVNRMGVAFHELLQQSSLTVEDKKRVSSMVVGDPMTPESVERAMRQLSTDKKRIYPVNYVEEESEEVHTVTEHEQVDEEQAIMYLAEQGDEEAQMIKEFEDQLIEVCQDNQDLAMCYSAYADARAKIRDRLRHRGFWPVPGQKGRGKDCKKGGRFDPGRFAKKDSLAKKITSSNCRRCGARGHWKWERPVKESVSKEDVHVVIIDETFSADHDEILDLRPEGLNEAETIEQLMNLWPSQDWENSEQTPLGVGFNSSVNDEFEESIFVCTLTRQKVNGHCLGSALIGAMSRRVDGESKGTSSLDVDCPAIIDTGASKTAVGQRKVKTLIQSMPPEIQPQMNWKKSETAFRFRNNAALPSVGALYLPCGKRWMKIKVVEGDTLIFTFQIICACHRCRCLLSGPPQSES